MFSIINTNKTFCVLCEIFFVRFVVNFFTTEDTKGYTEFTKYYYTKSTIPNISL